MTFNCTRMPQYAHLYSSAIRSRSRSADPASLLLLLLLLILLLRPLLLFVSPRLAMPRPTSSEPTCPAVPRCAATHSLSRLAWPLLASPRFVVAEATVPRCIRFESS